MKRIFSRYAGLLSLLITSVFALTSCAHNSAVPEKSPLSLGLEGVSYQPKAPLSWSLTNGLTVFYLQDDELPLVQGGLFIKNGGLWEPENRIGIASVLGEQMRQGGAGELSAEALDKELEHLAAGIAGSFGAEFGKFSFSCLGSDVDRVFSLFADVILRPRFQEDRIDLWKGQALEGIRRRSDDPGTIASIAFNQIIYDSTPYGRVVVDKDVQAITRAELIKMHQEMVTPRDAVLIISGNISRIAAEELIHKYFAKWGENERVLPPVPVVSSEPQPGIYFLEYPFAQSTVLMGQLGPKRLSPDYPQIEEFNEVFGSAGFSARLARRVRTELGLAYGVFGGILAGVDRGRALVQLQTKSESTGQAIVEAIEVIKGLQAAEATESELAEAQRSITNSFVFKFDSTEELIQRAALLQILGYPQDYDATYVPKIKNVDGADVQTVARKYWDPAKFVIVVVGNERAYNSLQRVLDEQPSALPGFKIQKMQFDQKLVM